jgi:predicted metal-binding membrane protein
MMLPSVVPAAGHLARFARRNTTVPFVTGYLAVWTVYGLAAYGLYRVLSSLDTGWLAWDARGRWVAGGVIVAAGIYESTPLKRRGLRRCRGARHSRETPAERARAVRVQSVKGPRSVCRIWWCGAG